MYICMYICMYVYVYPRRGGFRRLGGSSQSQNGLGGEVYIHISIYLDPSRSISLHVSFYIYIYITI